jgi:orotidine-5'-phosphate decarboxylase
MKLVKYHWGDHTAALVKEKGELVLGIDPVLADIPVAFRTGDACSTVKNYVDFVLSVTSAKIGFVKFQSAFFEAFGSRGVAVLAHGIGVARSAGLGIILDAKRGDIGSTAVAYARAYLEPGQGSDLEVDCMTVNPFLGPETVEPFIECSRGYGKGLFVLAKTSNPGSSWLQDEVINGETVSMRVARFVEEAGKGTVGNSGLSNVGAVVGATYASDAQRLRQLMPSSILLTPSIGPQGGAARDVKFLRSLQGGGILVPVSRGITQVADSSISTDAYGELIVRRIHDLAEDLK